MSYATGSDIDDGDSLVAGAAGLAATFTGADRARIGQRRAWLIWSDPSLRAKSAQKRQAALSPNAFESLALGVRTTSYSAFTFTFT